MEVIVLGFKLQTKRFLWAKSRIEVKPRLEFTARLASWGLRIKTKLVFSINRDELSHILDLMS